MRISFDVSDLCTDRADGTTRYTQELARLLPSAGAAHAWHYCAPCLGSGLTLPKGIHWAASPWPVAWTQTRLPYDLFRLRPDVLFMPIQQIPVVRPKKMKTVAVVHDLAVHRYPEQFAFKDRLLLRLFSAHVARRADHIIAVSQATADDIALQYGRTRNVHVVHHGVDHAHFYAPQPDEATTSWRKLVAAYPAAARPYILYVGQIQPRKNITRLVHAFEILAQERPELQLLVAGSHGWMQEPILNRVKRSPCADRIVMTGRVSEALLPALYWHAETFVLPSLYEGFGMPILEAMACGCPVVTSNVSSLPEVSGDAAVLVDPLDVNSIASGIRRAVAQRSDLIARGRARAQQFTWERTAQQTLAVLIS